MNKDTVMWKCPQCDRIVPDFLYMTRRGYGTCECECNYGTRIYYWQFDKFVLDKDDTIHESIDMESLIKDAINEVLDEELEKSYRVGYSRGFEEGGDVGYNEGYNDGQNDCYCVRTGDDI